jgi:hypothetical protein
MQNYHRNIHLYSFANHAKEMAENILPLMQKRKELSKRRVFPTPFYIKMMN